MAFDFKKEYKEFYLPPKTPGIVEIPSMNFLAVRGRGNPNEEGGEYSRAVEQLYGMAYTIKMSYKGSYKIKGFFEYVVPPLEGFWWQDGVKGVDYSRKDGFNWISLIRLPDFVNPADFDWALREAAQKKKADFSAVEFFTYHEGLCVQCMHIGPYDDEPATVSAMQNFAGAKGYAIDISDSRYHHEIYLGDPRKTEPANLKTVLRHPVRKLDDSGPRVYRV
ncbi:GyrI-like domain-containing protein [Treponema sp. OttesenSCG-928-L16]|nr:GyrI-like domain-containing protein [Treponema sp. OttesenSCG-928-L16]